MMIEKLVPIIILCIKHEDYNYCDRLQSVVF